MSTNNDQEANIIECRICHSKTARDLILSPCLCKGSLAFVHFRCLERWLNCSSRNSCELCSFPFNVIMNRRYTFLQSIRIWIRHPPNRTFIMFDLVIALILTVLTLILVSICLIGVNRFVEEGREQGIQTFWSEGIVNIFLIVLMTGYLITMYSMARDHVRHWYSWWIHCNNVTLLMDKSPEIMSTLPGPPLNHITNVSTNSRKQNVTAENKECSSEENSYSQDKCANKHEIISTSSITEDSKTEINGTNLITEISPVASLQVTKKETLL